MAFFFLSPKGPQHRCSGEGHRNLPLECADDGANSAISCCGSEGWRGGQTFDLPIITFVTRSKKQPSVCIMCLYFSHSGVGFRDFPLVLVSADAG